MLEISKSLCTSSMPTAAKVYPRCLDLDLPIFGRIMVLASRALNEFQEIEEAVEANEKGGRIMTSREKYIWEIAAVAVAVAVVVVVATWRGRKKPEGRRPMFVQTDQGPCQSRLRSRPSRAHLK